MTKKISQLPNGLRVVTEAMPHLETVSLGIWVGTGSRNESAAENGISHLLEHMAFKGTERRSAREIAESIENVGGDINAATSLDTTAYYARILKEDTPLAIDVFADILQHSVFDAGELAREKDVILQEIAASLDTPEDVVFDIAQELAFADQASGRSILGTPETLESFNADGLSCYLSRRYVPSRMIVSAAGAVDHDAIVDQVGEHFAGLAGVDAGDMASAVFTGGQRTAVRPIEQTHVVMAFEAPPIGTPEYYTAQVFAGLLGGGMSSRLFQKVREERGLCYSVYAYCWSMIDTGLFGVYAGTSAELVDEMKDVVRGELEDIAVNGPVPAELARAKAQMKSGLLMGLESSSVRAEQMARHMLTYGRTLETPVLTGYINTVSAEDIQAFAGKLVGSENAVWSEVGPDRVVADGIAGGVGGRHDVAALV